MFEWKPEYSVQIPDIDAQHQQLFALAATLHTAMMQGKGMAVLAKALADLLNYTRKHFADEERLMAQYQFPDIEKHKVEHAKLTAQVVEFQDRFRRKEAFLTVDLMQFLKTWLAQHISRSDQKYAALIRGKMAA